MPGVLIGVDDIKVDVRFKKIKHVYLLNAFTGCARPIKEKEYDHDGLRVNYDHKSHP